MSPARTPRPHRRPGPPADPLRDPPTGPAPAAAVGPAGSLDSFRPLIDLASIISDSRRDKAARHAEKPYPARKVQDLPGCYVRSSGFGTRNITQQAWHPCEPDRYRGRINPGLLGYEPVRPTSTDAPWRRVAGKDP